jgi:uncharacterized membrane protein YphA (DoxX/SURF4 family)
LGIIRRAARGAGQGPTSQRYVNFPALSRLPTYVLFLGFSFHGPDRWSNNPMEFGFFVDHFTFIAGLLFAAVHGPASALVLRRRAA